MSRAALVAVCLILGGLVHAQTALPAFEVASIKPNTSDSQSSNAGRIAGDTFVASNVTAMQLIRANYGFQDFQIVGLPGWANAERFDITARMAPGTTIDVARTMVHALMTERFQLRTHRERKEASVLALVVARGGLKIEPVASTRCDPSNRCGMSATPTRIESRGQSMEQFAARLSRSLAQNVVNKTGVDGIFDFTLEWTQEEQFRSGASSTIFTVLTEQLGLRLESQRGEVEVLVVDRIERPSAD
jgi:uncharacterized protein (TIGR03435 family)